MYHTQNNKPKLRIGLLRGIVLLLCLAMLCTSFQFGGIALIAEAADNDTVTITVNYVYESNQAMVAQPYTAQIKKGSAFRKTLEVPKLFNYSIPSDMAIGLSDNIVLSKDETTDAYSLNFDLSSVDEDITVILYYKAGTAKYTVYHYYQNLEDDTYTDVQPKVVELEGDIDAYTQAVAENTPGYHCKGVPQTTIAADGTTKVEIYYDRDYYTVTFDVNGGVNGPEPIYAKYGTTFEAKTIQEPSRKGYTFLGWQPILSDTVTIEGNATYVAQWQPEKGQADYTIVLWGQNANDDEYSYLRSHDAWGNVGSQVTWNEGTLISHVHTDECRKLTCGEEEHTHTAECYGCGHAPGHTLRPDCFGLSTNAQAVDPNNGYGDNDARTHFEDNCDNTNIWGTYICKGLKQYLKNGSVCQYKDGTREGFINVSYKYYYFLYLNDQYFEITEAQYNSLKSNTGKSVDHGNDTYYVYEGKTSECNHTHKDDCLICGKTEHTHDSSCGTLICKLSDTPKKYMLDIKPDSALWVFDHSDTVTVDANGSTVLNVYFTRTIFKLEFRKAYSNSNDFGTINARWGKNIASEYNAIVKEAGSSFWSRNRAASGPYTNYIGVMPAENRTYYNKTESGQSNTMYYYAENLNGQYEEIFRISFGGTYSVTDEDRYEFEGYTCDLNASAKNGVSCDGAKFYYKRNTYALEFYSASNSEPDRTVNPLYQEPLGKYDYTPTSKPSTVEPDAVFVGWYQNPECTGEQYDLSAHTMPSNNIALYAKWVNGLYTVTTYTDDTVQTLYTYGGYDGKQENIEKYTLAVEPTPPAKEGYVFIGWFYKNGETEKPFSFTMPITKDYDLYPKFSEPQAVTYTVHYCKAGTTEKVADDRTNSVMIGTTVTEKAKMGTELNLLPADKQNKYYPTNTSTSVIINQLDQEIIFYYTEASSVSYTVYYKDANGNNLIEPVTKSTEYSTVTEQYVPIANYAPRQFSITQDLSSDAAQNTIVFVYDPTLSTLTIQKSGWDTVDENQTFLFHIKGTDENTKGIDLTVTVHGNGKTTITDLPVGSYTVTEKSNWSWRYTPSGNESQNITIGAGGAVLPFVNNRTDGKWLSGDSFKINHFGSNQ